MIKRRRSHVSGTSPRGHGRARHSGMGPGGDCSMVLWVPGPRGQHSGKIRFIEKTRVQRLRVAMWLNVVLTLG